MTIGPLIMLGISAFIGFLIKITAAHLHNNKNKKGRFLVFILRAQILHTQMVWAQMMRISTLETQILGVSKRIISQFFENVLDNKEDMRLLFSTRRVFRP